MSGLETAIKPLLSGLILGEHLEIDSDGRNLLSRYLAMKLAVVDWSNSDPVISQIDRDLIKSGDVPSHLSIDIFYSPDAKSIPFYTQSACRLYRVGGDGDAHPNVRLATLQFGKMIVSAFYSRRVLMKPRLAAVRTHPAPDCNILWPANLPLLNKDIAMLEQVINPNAYEGRILARNNEIYSDVSCFIEIDSLDQR